MQKQKWEQLAHHIFSKRNNYSACQAVLESQSTSNFSLKLGKKKPNIKKKKKKKSFPNVSQGINLCYI